MTLNKRVAGILVTVFTAGLAGITISQTGVRPAHLFHSRTTEVHYEASRELYADEAQFHLLGAPTPMWPRLDENSTPEERERMMRKFLEDMLRQGLTRAGFPQDDLQDAAVEFQRVVETDRRSIREKGGKLRAAMADGSSDAQIAVLMADLRRAVAIARMRRDQARKELNAKTAFTKKPKLDATLSLYGLGGDESSYLMMSFGGFGRRNRDSGRR